MSGRRPGRSARQKYRHEIRVPLALVGAIPLAGLRWAPGDRWQSWGRAMKDKPTTAAIPELGFYCFSLDDHLPVTPAWQESSVGGHLPEDEVHLWFVDLDRFEEPLEIILRTLATDELARALRFRFDIDRRRFIVRRG